MAHGIQYNFTKEVTKIMLFLIFGTCSFIFKEEKVVRALTHMNNLYHSAWRGHKGEKDDQQSLYSGVWVLFRINRIRMPANQKGTTTSSDISQNTWACQDVK